MHRPFSCLVVALFACESALPPIASRAAPIVNGDPDSGDPAVVAIVFPRATGHALCSGTLIGTQTVLTAGHCTADPIINPQSQKLCTAKCKPEDFSIVVAFGANLDEALAKHSWVRADDYQHDPGFRYDPAHPRDAHPEYDVGLIHLASNKFQNGDALPARAPLGLPSSLADARLVGYGITSGFLRDDGVKHQVARPGISISGNTLDWLTEMRDLANSCGGDSGGPVFVKANGAEYLTGVISGGDGPCLFSGVAARVDPSYDFIRAFLVYYGDSLAPAPVPLPPQTPANGDPSGLPGDGGCTSDADCMLGMSCDTAQTPPVCVPGP